MSILNNDSTDILSALNYMGCKGCKGCKGGKYSNCEPFLCPCSSDPTFRIFLSACSDSICSYSSFASCRDINELVLELSSFKPSNCNNMSRHYIGSMDFDLTIISNQCFACRNHRVMPL